MTSPSLTYPLIDRVIPLRSAALRIPVQLALGVLLMALLSQLEVMIGPVPITGQTLGVLLIGAAYGGRLGSLTLLAYLLVGGLGLSVFSGGGAGWAHFTGATAGYLVSFPLVAGLMGYLAQRGLTRTFGQAVGVMLLGNLVIYGFGLVWLSTFAAIYAPAGSSPLVWTLQAGLVPFIPGDVVKLLLAATFLPLAERLLSAKRQAL